MKSAEIRQKFVDFFKDRGHIVVPGIPLIPPEDPTLLFTSAGMVQFKNFWASSGEIPYARAVSVQKILRAGGKDSDLENVGYDMRHHAFFEMLGNFSFGDYFKEGAIDFAWEFLTEHLRLPQEKLWVSVFREDEDAYRLWQKYMPVARMVRLGEKDNFWGPAGETGACGPCSEIYFDRGPEYGCGHSDCGPGCDCERYLEFWNLVFPQFNKTRDGFLPLNRPGIDTGMGLERITALCEGVESNFDTDLFQPIIKHLEELTGVGYRRDKDATIAFRAVADHIRVLTFAVAENIMPANEGRGYVIRRILRRAVKFLRVINRDRPEVSLSRLVPDVVKIMAPHYPYLAEAADFVSGIVAEEEARFLDLLKEGKGLFRQFAPEFKKHTVLGKTVFQLYDTYGLPLDTIRELAAEENLTLDEAGFEAELSSAKETSRKATSFELVMDRSALADLSPTEFVGYEIGVLQTEVLAVIPLDQGRHSLVLPQTPFYPERGGQVGDQGLIRAGAAEFIVTETKVDDSGFIHHIGTLRKGEIAKGSAVSADVNLRIRRQTAANHTATHLLHSALRRVLGGEVKQAGSLVSAEGLRFDFLFAGELKKEQLDRVEALVNEAVFNDIPVSREEKELKEAIDEGAIALFTEKYGRKVRVVTVGDFSKEVCGGIHIDSTAVIGSFILTAASSVGKGIKRVEAVTGKSAYAWSKQRLDALLQTSAHLKVEPLALGAEISRREEEDRKTRRKMDALLPAYLRQEKERIIKGKRAVSGYELLSGSQALLSPDEARLLVDDLRSGSSNSIVLMLLTQESRCQIFLGLTKDLVAGGLKAGDILRGIASAFGGGAGGRADFAQAGLKKAVPLPEVEKVLISQIGKGLPKEQCAE